MWIITPWGAHEPIFSLVWIYQVPLYRALIVTIKKTFFAPLTFAKSWQWNLKIRNSKNAIRIKIGNAEFKWSNLTYYEKQNIRRWYKKYKSISVFNFFYPCYYSSCCYSRAVFSSLKNYCTTRSAGNHL